MSKSYILPHVGELLEAVNVEYRAMLGPAAVDPAQRQRITSTDQHQIIIGYVLEFPKGLSTRLGYAARARGATVLKKSGIWSKIMSKVAVPRVQTHSEAGVAGLHAPPHHEPVPGLEDVERA